MEGFSFVLQHSFVLLSPFPDIELGRENGVRNAILVSIISEDKALEEFSHPSVFLHIIRLREQKHLLASDIKGAAVKSTKYA